MLEERKLMKKLIGGIGKGILLFGIFLITLSFSYSCVYAQWIASDPPVPDLFLYAANDSSSDEDRSLEAAAAGTLSIAAGGIHTLAIKSDGTLWAWGANEYGQLGDGTGTDKHSPVQIGADHWISIAAGGVHSLGIKSDGTLWAWGANGVGQLGDGTGTLKASPVQIGGDHWISITAGEGTSLGLKSDGTLWAWGYNEYGQLGDGTTVTKLSPVQIGTDHWYSIAAGGYHTLGLKSDGTLWAWGSNAYGQLGDGTTIDKHMPVQISTAQWDSITAGCSHSLGLKSDGTLWAWGANEHGQLGNRTTTEKHSPVQIGTAHWVTIATGAFHNLGITSNGTLWAWGYNNYGQLGNRTTRDGRSPGQISKGQWVSISAGEYHSLGVKSDGTVWAWGDNTAGKLGDGTTTNRKTPVKINLSFSPTVFYTITVQKSGSGSGTVTSSPAGINCGSDCNETYNSGTGVTLTAAAASGSTFQGWSGGGCSGTGTCMVTMDASKTVTATFTLIPPTQYTLTVNIVGSGSVAKNPNKSSYNQGEQVQLTATPGSGYSFSNWTGDASGTANPVTVTMNGNKTVTATFTLIPPTQYTLTVNIVGSGSVAKNPNKSSYNQGEQVQLTATPVSGYSFSNWTGDASGTANPVTVTMNGNKTVTATFTLIPPTQYTLTVNIVGSGSVAKNPNKSSYNQGEQVQLTATPVSGYSFSNWTGDASGTANPVTVTMNGNKTVTATFTLIPPTQYTLTVNIVGSGSVAKNPNKSSYNQGEQVQLTATPGSGYSFSNWTGDASGTANPVTVTMNGNKTVTATFNAAPPVLRIVNKTHYDMIDIKLNNQQMVAYPHAILPQGQYDFTFATPGTVDYNLGVGFYNNGVPQNWFLYSGRTTVSAGQTTTITFNNPTIGQFLSNFNQGGRDWVGEYWHNLQLGWAKFHFGYNGSWTFYDNNVQKGTGSVILVSWPDYGVIIQFKLCSTCEIINWGYPFGCFKYTNGPSDWRIIEYCAQ